jgi:tRNA-Thr(GGU) m(6)t(6)A37 methyltransferase TsaA
MKTTSETELVVRPIGYIRTPFKGARDTPKRPTHSGDATGEVVVFEEYAAALEGIEDFERIWLLFWMGRARKFMPRVVANLDGKLKGLFATRAPCRPNPIGISPARLVERRGNILVVRDIDMFDGTPIVDIKPYLPES